MIIKKDSLIKGIGFTVFLIVNISKRVESM